MVLPARWRPTTTGVYDAIILKTLGATRGRLISAYALKYTLLGGDGHIGVAAGSVAAWLVRDQDHELSFVWLPIPALMAALGALAVTVVFGLPGHLRRLGKNRFRLAKPAEFAAFGRVQSRNCDVGDRVFLPQSPVSCLQLRRMSARARTWRMKFGRHIKEFDDVGL